MEHLLTEIILLLSLVAVFGLPKDGKCPMVPSSSGGICVQECYEDIDCPNIQLCCSNGCGHTCVMPECDTSKKGFTNKTPRAMMDNGKCPSGSRTQSFINGQRLCCEYFWEMSDTPACPVEFTEPLQTDGCSRISGNCQMGWTCQHHAADGWHVCCRENAPPSCEDSDRQCQPGEVCVLEDVVCITTPCDPIPQCRACDRVCPANLVCQYGRKKDDVGCDLCECNPPPIYCKGITCGDGEICMRVDNTGIQCDCPAIGPCFCPDTYESQCVSLTPECGDSPMVCDDRCEHGYLPDSRGCPYCLHCNPDPYPADACPVLQCNTACQSGKARAVDENGCPTCECYHPTVECPLIKCLACEAPTPKYNYLENGCRGCECVSDVVCPQLQCRCPDGYKHETDINGCESCECIPVSVCGPVCQKYCKHGMVMDEYGCPICQCWEPHPCEEKSCSAIKDTFCAIVMAEVNSDEIRPEARCLPAFNVNVDCPDLACHLECEHGFAYNEDGCPICHCDPYRFPPYTPCNLPKAVVGDCDAAFNKWTFDSESETCEAFTYGGCGGNENRFDSAEECEEKCLDNVCNLPKAISGSCEADIKRWTYNSIAGKCEQFSYGGCGGNANRFESVEECEDNCLVGGSAVRSGGLTLIFLMLNIFCFCIFSH